jgi:hypothetical protein
MAALAALGLRQQVVDELDQRKFTCRRTVDGSGVSHVVSRFSQLQEFPWRR